MELDIGNLFIGELLVTSENRTLDFLNSGIFVDGRNKEKRIGKLKINWIVSRSLIYLSGRTQGSVFWADLLAASFGHNLDSTWPKICSGSPLWMIWTYQHEILDQPCLPILDFYELSSTKVVYKCYILQDVNFFTQMSNFNIYHDDILGQPSADLGF